MSSSNRVTDIDVGTSPHLQEWETVRVHFHNFKSEIRKAGGVQTQEFERFGTKWYITIYDDYESDNDDNNIDNDDEHTIDITLWKAERSSVIHIDYKVIIKDLDGGYILNGEGSNEKYFQTAHGKKHYVETTAYQSFISD